nr:hypothetical protein [Fusarium oxysporum]
MRTPIKTYSNAERDKFILYKDNNKKSGIYRWNNLITSLRLKCRKSFSLRSPTLVRYKKLNKELAP